MAITKVNPAEVENALRGVSFPATKDEVVNHAKAKNVSQEILSALHGIPGGDYNSVDDVTKALK